MVRALVHQLTARVVEDDHSVLRCRDLIEHEKEPNIHLMSNGKCWPPLIEAYFSIEINQVDCPGATYVCPQGDRPRNLPHEWPKGVRNWKDP